MPPNSEKVTIIIPVYNSEYTIAKCIYSLKNQSHQNLEIIIINDHSTDQSLSNIYQAIASDNKFEVINQHSNQGPSAARNLGIKNGTGKFLFFLDADDWLEHNAIEVLVDLSKRSSCHLICADHIQEFDNRSIQKSASMANKDHVFSTHELLCYIKKYLKSPYKYTLLVHCWGKLYDLNLVKSNNVQFNEELSQLEDVNFNYQYLIHCNKVAYKNTFIYHHRISSSSQSLSTLTGTEENAIKKHLIAFSAIESFLKKYDNEALIQSKKEISHLFITTVIITTIRLCKKMIATPTIETYNKLAVISKSPEVASRLKFYTRGSNESMLIPIALKTNITLLLTISGIIRALIK